MLDHLAQRHGMAVHLGQPFDKAHLLRRLVVFLRQGGGDRLAQGAGSVQGGVAGDVGLARGGGRAAVRGQVGVHHQDPHLLGAAG